MFEYEQDVVDELRNTDRKFEKLYQEHKKLKKKVRDAKLGMLPLDDFTVEKMKKRKLLAKDRMAMKIARYKRENVTA
ncbi:MAG: YdcH family protein [Pseudomonadota bacterium]